jgi:ribosomal peptide maturation radical SAM protein 1
MPDGQGSGNQKPFHVALISTPWPLFNRPSIQVGALTAYLRARQPDVTVSSHHLYLDIAAAVGYAVYQAISRRTWLAEAVAAALYFPELAESARTLFNRHARSDKRLTEIDFSLLVETVKSATHRFVASRDWQEVNLVGCTISLCQLTCSLYVIHELKARNRRLPVVVGGSSLSMEGSDAFWGLFHDIDFLIVGEGERPLDRLVLQLKRGRTVESVLPGPGLLCRGASREGRQTTDFDQLPRLDELPAPDYDAYFHHLGSLAPTRRFFAKLPVEASRGCWWQSRHTRDSLRGCAFCNLNLQWSGYRTKKVHQVAAEVRHLISRHQLLSLCFVDNALPPAQSWALFRKLGDMGVDLDIFAEVRAPIPLKTLEALRDAGLTELQVGVEALSTRLLKKMNKGTRTIDNLQIMKDCEALGVVSASNLILDFPGSDAQDVAETLEGIEFAQPLRPLKCVRFWLGLASPVWLHPRRYGIRATFNHPNWTRLLPKSMVRRLQLPIQDYRGPKGELHRLWRPVRERVRRWQKDYKTMQDGHGHQPPLTFLDGGNFMLILQRQPHGSAIKHRLTGSASQIYRFCQQHRSLQRLLATFDTIGQDRMLAFLHTMVDKKLMYHEAGRYLSLAAARSCGRRGRQP